jgi:NTP pyrophosphatase (non-canonical NTP hydrolase)
MTFDEFQKRSLRTAHCNDPLNAKLAMCGLGVAGEAGEVADEIKKILYHGHALDRYKLADEAGDVLWYLAFLAHTLDLSFDEIAERSVKKLLKRYPNGFDPELSKNREAK